MDSGAVSYQRFIQGDDSAFEELVTLYGHCLILFINGYVNNIASAEDLMEDTFCELFLHKNRFKGKSSFKTYLFSIARNKAVSYIRKASKLTILPPEDTSGESEELEEIILKHDRNRQLYRALGSIRKEYREILYLFFFEEMNYEDISIVLKKSKGQIKNLIYRAKLALRECLQDEGFGYET